MKTSITMDTGALTKALRDLAERDVRIAATWALDDMAEDIRKDVADRMRVVFDRPKDGDHSTVNAFKVVNAKPSQLQASVELRPWAAKRHYLRVEEEGGPRPQQGFEKLVSAKLADAGVVQSIIPTDNARLDKNGNWSRGELAQVMSSLGVQPDARKNTTAASRKRNKSRARYFVPESGLSRDIYKREANGQISVVATISTKVPVYQQRLGFFDNAGQLFAAKMPEHLARTLSKMIAKRFG